MSPSEQNLADQLVAQLEQSLRWAVRLRTDRETTDAERALIVSVIDSLATLSARTASALHGQLA